MLHNTDVLINNFKDTYICNNKDNVTTEIIVLLAVPVRKHYYTTD